MGGISSGLVAYKLAFQISPIMFEGGIASAIPRGILPLLSISNAISFVGGLLTPGDNAPDLDGYFAYFQPLAGGTLIDQQIGMYPFANQSVAANAVIQQPLTISMLMICPAGGSGGYLSKPSIMASIQSSFQSHNTSGGTYSILTLAGLYSSCVMTSMTDISTTTTKQVQNTYKLDFLKPLVSLQQAAQAYNGEMGQIASALPPVAAITGNIPGPVGPVAGPVQGPQS